MNKQNILFLTILLLIALNTGLSAQYSDVDFEPGGLGAEWAWTVGDNGSNPPLEFFANPSMGGINSSDTAAKFIAEVNGQPWALCFTDENGEFTFDANNSTVTIMVHKPVTSVVAIKFEGTSPDVELNLSNTVIDEWEELVFDFSASIGNTYDRLVIIPDFEARTEERIIYFDNIQLPEGDYTPVAEPETAATTPSFPTENVISLFCNAYTDVPVDTWSADWDDADVEDIQIEDNNTKLYTNLVFAGIEFTSQTIDATNMTHFHMDIWTPDATALPAIFKIKLVDFGADGVFGGGDDVEHELIFDETTTPGLASENWINFNIPLSDFTNLTTTGHLAQLIIAGDPNTVYVDNVLFNSGGTQSIPEVAAPTPTIPEANVISLFSNTYTDVSVDTWSADWDDADVTDLQIEGNDTKLYTNLVVAGIEFISQTIDATDMTHFHMDFWTPDPTTLPAEFKIKLVDFGADGAWGGGDDVEHELMFDEVTTPALISEDWLSFDLPLADFTGLTTTGHLAQIVLSGDPNTVYLDNVYLYNNGVDAGENTLSIVPAELGNNFPNPFNPVTIISYTIHQTAQVSLKVYDVKGRLVESLVDGERTASTYQQVWNAENVSSGVYFYQLTINNEAVDAKRMILLK